MPFQEQQAGPMRVLGPGLSLTLSWPSWLPDSSDLILPQAPQSCEPRSSVGQILPSAELGGDKPCP